MLLTDKTVTALVGLYLRVMFVSSGCYLSLILKTKEMQMCCAHLLTGKPQTSEALAVSSIRDQWAD